MKEKSEKMSDDLKKIIIQLKNSERKLNASNQQLEASNQQLAANEQQLRAANQQLTSSEQQLKAANQQLAASNQQFIASEQEIKKYVHDLSERVKELDCLYGISESVRTRESIEETLQDTVDIIPQAWQYPKITRGKVRFEGKEYVSQNFKESKWKQSADIIVTGKVGGTIEVNYLEECPESDEGPFMKEERNLINLITKIISEAIEHKKSEEELKAANQQLEANNQQLIASEQQLRAANQQLVVSEQQLKVSNQQLSASEKVLQKEKNFSENLMETANSFVVVLDMKANITLFNRYAEKLTNFKKEDVLGKNWFDLFIPQQSGNKTPKVFSQLLKEMPEFSSYENSILLKDGSERLISWSNTVLKDENRVISGVLNIGIDITERKLAEQKLKESEKKFEYLVKNSNDVFVIVDENVKEIYVSDSVELITGFPPSETIGHSGLEFLHPDDIDHISKVFSELLKTPWGTIRDEYRHQRKGGGWVYLEAIGTNYLDEPSIKGIVLNIRDITERKHAEVELKKKMNELEILNNATVGRELKIIELKKEINELLAKSGQKPKYEIPV